MSGVPSNIIIPFVGVSFDNSRAVSGPSNMPMNLVYVGQMTAAGTGVVNTLIPVTSADEVGVLAGPGSMAHRQAIKGFKVNQSTKAYVILLADGAGTAATFPMTLDGVVTANGELVTYIAGVRIATAAVVDDTFDVVAAQHVLDINAKTDLQVTAVYATPILTVTCKNKGIAAGDLDVRFNANEGEAFPDGLTVTLGTSTAGTIDPDVQDALDAIGDVWVNVGTQPYTDNTSMAAVEDHATAQAGVMVQHDGVWYQNKRATLAEMITFGEDVANHNNPYMSTHPGYKRMESTYEVAASVAAAAALSVEDDPAVPLHRMPLTGLKPLASSDRWDAIERNQLANAGISTLTDDLGVQTEAMVTMYLKNSAGADDDSYQQQNTIFQLMRLRYRFVNRIATRYPRAKLVKDASKITTPGQQVMSIAVGKAEAISWFKIEEADGQVEDLEEFKKNLVVQKSDDNANRLEWLLPPDLVNQFIVGSGNMQFRIEG